MNRKPLYLMAGLAAILALFACSDTVVQADPPINTEASAKFVVIDYFTKAPVKDASVNLPTEGKGAKTDAYGAAVIGGIRVGSNTVRVEKDGYAAIQWSFDIKSVSDAGKNKGVFVAGDESFDFELFPLNASLEGYLFFNDKGQSKPASGATVRVTFDSGFIVGPFEAEVGEDGKYSFEKLPAGIYPTIQALQIKLGADSTLYKGHDISYEGNLLPNATAKVELATLGVQSTFELLSYTGKVGPRGDVVFTFNEEIDPKTVNDFLINYASSSYYDIIANGKTLTLKLFNSEWSNNFFVFCNGLKSKSGQTTFCNEDITIDFPALTQAAAPRFVINSYITDMKDIAADGNVSSIELSWNKVDYATSYTVYGKASKGSNKYDVVCNNSSSNSCNVDMSNLGFGVSSQYTLDLNGKYYESSSGDYIALDDSTYIVKVGSGGNYYFCGFNDCGSYGENNEYEITTGGTGTHNLINYDYRDYVYAANGNRYYKFIYSVSNYSLEAGNIKIGSIGEPLICDDNYFWCTSETYVAPFADGGTLEFIVQAIRNDADKTPLAGANKLELKK